jgi:hypothetical protein
MICHDISYRHVRKTSACPSAAVVLAIAGTAVVQGLGQSYWADQDPSRGFAIQNSQVMPYRPGFGGAVGGGFRRAPYNMLIGPVSARFSTGLSLSYTDNALLSDQALGSGEDFIITPMVNTAFEWQITEMNGIRLDVGIGYQKHINLTEFDSLIISPNSTIDWQVVLGDVRISLFNQTSTPSEVNQRPELAGTGSAASVAFRRIQNSSGLSASWQAAQDLSVQGGYTYGIERGLVTGFDNLDRDSHIVSAAVYERLNPVWTVGLNGSYSIFSFNNGFQNNATAYSGGVLGAWHPSRFLNVSANVRYNVTSFESSGLVTDTSNFNGINFDVVATHRFHRDWNHSLSVGQGVNTGLGSNFTKQFTTTYGLFWNGIENLGVNLSGSYAIVEESGTVQSLPRDPTFRISPAEFDPSVPGMVDEGFGRLFYFPPGFVDRGNGVVDFTAPGRKSDLFQVSIGATRSFGRKLSGSLIYTHSFRTSDIGLRGFAQNIVTLSANYQF